MTHLNVGSFQAEPERPMGEKLLGKKEQKKGGDEIQGYREGKERSEKRRNREVAKEKKKLRF